MPFLSSDLFATLGVAVCLSVLSSLLLLQRVRTGFVERLQGHAEESGKSRKSGCLPNSFIHTRLPQTDKLASTLVCFYSSGSLV